VTGAIKTLFLHVTKACNLRCRYCYFSAAVPEPGEMTRPEYAHLWPAIVAVAPTKLVFTGGEPLLRRGLLDLAGDLAECDDGHVVKRCLNTNGTGMTAALARRLVGVIDEMRVSLDGPREVHDRVRGHGSFYAAIAAINMLRDEGFEPKVLVTITADSLEALPGFLQWLASQSLTRVRLNPVRLTGRATTSPELAVRSDDVARAVAQARIAIGNHKEVDEPVASLPRSCGVGHFINLMPNGDVFPCHVLTEPAFRVGNVRLQGLNEMIGPQSLLGRLRDLDLGELARDSPAAADTLTRLTCLGSVQDEPYLVQRLSLLRQ